MVLKETRAGGLALLWRNSVQIDVYSPSLNHIDVIVDKGKENSWSSSRAFMGCQRLVGKVRLGIYFAIFIGNTPYHGCAPVTLMRSLLSHEKLGGALRSETTMREFREVVDDRGFMDLGYVGKEASMEITWCWKG